MKMLAAALAAPLALSCAADSDSGPRCGEPTLGDDPCGDTALPGASVVAEVLRIDPEAGTVETVGLLVDARPTHGDTTADTTSEGGRAWEEQIK